jgi:hypothetical protein
MLTAKARNMVSKTLLFSITAALSTVYIARIGTLGSGSARGIGFWYLSLPDM